MTNQARNSNDKTTRRPTRRCCRFVIRISSLEFDSSFEFRHSDFRCKRPRHQPGRLPRGEGVGAVLLEVLLALALFCGAAGVIMGSLTSSVRAVDRLRLEAQAADLAVTTLSEI